MFDCNEIETKIEWISFSRLYSFGYRIVIINQLISNNLSFRYLFISELSSFIVQ